MLPKKNGWEVLQSLKTDPSTSDIPVVIHSILEERELAFALGANDYIVEPADKASFVKKLGELSFLHKRRRLPVNILITEDDRCRRRLKEMTESEGFIFHHYRDPEDALAASLMIKPPETFPWMRE